MKHLFLFLIFVLFSSVILAQDNNKEGYCATDNIHLNLLKSDSKYAEREILIEKNYREWFTDKNSDRQKTSNFDAVTLPIVFHDLTSAQDIYSNTSTLPNVIQALNSNFLNASNINFCLARVNNQGASFISSMSTGAPTTLEKDDQSQITLVSNIIQSTGSFPTTKYINIYIVDDIAGSVAGFAYGPAAHGTSYDGIYIEKQYIVNYIINNNIVVLTHEMGHYLGLIHTFGRCQPLFQACSCNNDNCLLDGDMVCDTPPDFSISPTPLLQNTCTTDDIPTMNNGTNINPITSDIADFTNNYMDYGDWAIQNSFTDGQATRMRNMIDPVIGARNSLLNSNVCNATCNLGSTCSITIDDISPVTQILGISYPNTLVLSGNNVSYTFNATIANCSGLNTYAWQVTNLDTNTVMPSGSSTNSFTTIFSQTGNYQISLISSIANSNPLCFKTTTLNIKVVLPASNSGTGNCINIDWSDPAFERISYSGGWVHADNDLTSNVMRDATSTGPIIVTTPNNTANNSSFAIINGSIPSTDTTFGGTALPNGINQVFRVGKVIDGDNINNPLTNGTADYVTYTFTPTEEMNKIRVYYLGLREDFSAGNTLISTFHREPQHITSNGFGMVFGNYTPDFKGVTHNYTDNWTQNFNSFLYESSPYSPHGAAPRSNITIGNTNYISTSNWAFYDLDLSYYACMNQDVKLTFYARTSTALDASSHSYAYFGLQCLPSVPETPVIFDLPNIHFDCLAQTGSICHTFSTPIVGANLNPFNSGIPFNNLQVATSFDGINYTPFSTFYGYINGNNLNFELCKESDTNPYKYFKVRYITPCQTYEDVVTLHQGFTHYVDPCPTQPSTTPRGGLIPTSYNGNNVITISKCNGATIVLDKPCWWEEDMEINYQWQINEFGNWINININGSNEDLIIDATNFYENIIYFSNCNKLRRIAKYEDPYCKTPVWISSEEFTLVNFDIKIPLPVSSNQNDVCLGENVNISTNLNTSYPHLYNCLDQSIQNSTTVSFIRNNSPISGTFFDSNGTILFQGTSYTYHYLSQNIPQIFFSFVNQSNSDFSVTLLLNSMINGCNYINSDFNFTINVKPSAIAGEIAIMPCSNPLDFVSVNTDNNNNLGYQWQYSYNNITFNSFNNSNIANFTLPNGLAFTSYPVFIRRMAYGTQDCPNVAYSNVITLNSLQSVIPNFTQIQPICEGVTSVTLPTTSLEGITGTWSPALNTASTTTYTFLPNAGQCSEATTMTINVNPIISPTFVQVQAICEGETSVTLPNTSLEGISGTWSPALNSSATTTYTFTPNADQCSLSTTMTITVIPSVTVTFVQVPAICKGDILVALPTTSLEGIIGTWSPALDNTETTTYTFTPTNSGICAITTMTITVKPNEPASFVQVQAICEGDILAALPTTSLDGITGTWSPALNNTITTTYTFTPNNSICTGTSMTITVNPNVTPTFMQVPAICAGATLTALPRTSLEGITGNWSPALNNTTTTTYTFTPHSELCALETTMTIIVESCQEECPTLIASNSNICHGQSVLLTVQGGASTYTVQPGNIVLTTGVPQLVTPLTGTTTYSIAAVGNCSETSITVTVNNTSSLTLTASNTNICTGESITLTPLGLPAGTIYTLLPNNVTGTGPFTLNPTSSSIYSIVTFLDCCPLSSEINIIVRPCDSPCEVNATFIYDEKNCKLTNTSTSNTSTTITSFEWKITDVSGNLVYQNSTNSVLNLAWILPNGTYNVCLFVYGNEAECEDKFCLEVKVNCRELSCDVNATFIYDEKNCKLTNTSTSNTSTTITSFEWKITDISGNLVYQNSTNSVLNLAWILPNGTYNVCLFVYGNGAECEDKFCHEVKVNCRELSCDVNATFIYDEKNCKLTNTSTSNTSTTITSFEWKITDISGNLVYQNSTNSVLNLARILPNGTYNVCLFVYGNGAECEDKFCLEVKVNCEELLLDPVIYPNPNTGKEIIISRLGKTKYVRLSVTDIQGKLILKTILPVYDGNAIFSLDVDTCLYFIYIEDTENKNIKFNFKLLIEKNNKQ